MSTELRSRPDAVDLVTEGHHTPESVIGRERQQPSPKLNDAKRAVSQWLVSPRKHEVGSNANREFDSKTAQSTDRSVAEETGTEAVGNVARLETPPQTQLVSAVYLYDDLENDENPWS